MRQKLTIAFLIILSVCSLSKAYAQTVVMGTVTDKTHIPLPGANVSVLGTTIGVSTNAEGKYALTIPDNLFAPDTKLLFSFIGYNSLEIDIKNNRVIDVSLTEVVSSLDEVIVVGYGSQSKRNVTGAISKVDISKTENVPNINIGQSLRGRVAGVQFIDNGRPGQNGSILIRGKRSLSASNSPLIVLDGIIFNGSLQDINQNDIESIEILKDASASAIYGSRAANGVILVTSKMGKTEKANLNINVFQGFSDYGKKIKLLSPKRYLQYFIDYNKELGKNVDMSNVGDYLSLTEANNYEANKTIDPWEEASQKAFIRSADLNISGQSKRNSYFVSASIADEAGLIYNDQQKRISWRSNFESKITDWLTFGLNLNYVKRDNSGIVADVGNIILSSPYGTWFHDDGLVTKLTVDGENVSVNPLYYSLITKNENITHNLFTNFVADVDIPFIKGLSYRMNYSPNMIWNHNYEFRINDVHWPGNIAYAKKTPKESYNWTLENIVKYKKQINKDNSFDISLLYSKDFNKSESTTARSELFASEALGWNGLNLGSLQTVGSSGIEVKGVSYMARINYNLRNRYFVTLTTRRDGSSVFATNNKYGTFPSSALAWIISDEDFLKKSKIINLLKLRLSYGAVGNQAIDPYQSMELLGSTQYVFGEPGTTYYGVYPGNMANNDLKWETTYTANAAVDFELFNNRIGGTVEIYNMDTKNLLVERSLPVMTGFGDVWDNLGATNNKGIEFTLNTNNIDSKEFKWSSSLTFSYNKNKIVHLYHSDVNGDGKEDDDLGNSWFIGKPIDLYYDYVFDGIYQEGDILPANTKAGDVRLKDYDGNGLDASDRRIIGQSKTPKFRWGVENDFTYKNLTLSVFVNAMQGWISSFPRGISPGRSLNFIDQGWWTPENKSNTQPSINYQNKYGINYYMSRDFVRIQDISLAYNFPTKLIDKAKLNNCRVFLSVKNLYTFSNWKGSDPEIGGTSTASFYPMSRTISIGLNLGF